MDSIKLEIVFECENYIDQHSRCINIERQGIFPHLENYFGFSSKENIRVGHATSY